MASSPQSPEKATGRRGSVRSASPWPEKTSRKPARRSGGWCGRMPGRAENGRLGHVGLGQPPEHVPSNGVLAGELDGGAAAVPPRHQSGSPPDAAQDHGPRRRRLADRGPSRGPNRSPARSRHRRGASRPRPGRSTAPGRCGASRFAAVAADHHAGMLGEAHADAAAMVQRDPGRAARAIEERVEERPVGHGVRAVAQFASVSRFGEATEPNRGGRGRSRSGLRARRSPPSR